ncbi:MAG TPA: VC0807 family protein [Roseiflexaceae bacterium]|nr:VC0807 family protein [Roseiflexaceae bacterium]
MKRSTKLFLDILMGAVVPILILSYLTRPLGAPMAYLAAALVPVGWVFADLLLITRRFNFITSYVGLSAVVRGALAFWFVDGWQFALKDSAGAIVAALVFALSALVGHPIMRAFLMQALAPDTPERAAALARLLAEPPVARAIVGGNSLVLAWNLVSGAINFLLNLRIVTAPFGIEAFNQQVAQVNAITRIALALPEFVVFGVAFWLIFRALYRSLPSEAGKPQMESDFWELVRLREAGSG